MEQFKVFTNPGPASFNELMGEDGFPVVFETEQEARDFIAKQKKKKTLRVGRVSADGATHILDDVTEEKK